MRINIVSTYTTDILKHYLEILFKEFIKVDIQIFYNQIFEQLIFQNSEFNANDEGLNVLIIRLSDFIKYDPNSLGHEESNIEELINAFNDYKERQKVPSLIIFTPSYMANQQAAESIKSIEKKIQDKFKSAKNVFVLNSDEILNNLNTNDIFNSYTDNYGHIPYESMELR